MIHLNLANLAEAFALAKAEEARAAALRRDLAAQIQATTGHTAEGAKTYDADGWKVTVKVPLVSLMDWGAWETVKASIPQDLWPVEMKPSLDEKGVKWLMNNEPETYALLAPALTVKPGAPGVTVTPKEKGN